MSPDRYRQKRDFDETPEPAVDSSRAECGGMRFVVHRHEARRLHYDLRLEIDNVLKSWAVPKGFSYDSKDKHLAIHTEDHPLKYVDFAGVIPAGQYGAGTVSIWDHGRFELAGDVDGLQAIADGKILLRLFGCKLRGEWHLLRSKSETNQWIMFKSKDRYARSKDEPPFAIDLTSAKRRGLPKRRYPFMKPSGTVPPFFDSDWIYEAKLDGRRVLVDKRVDEIRIRDGRGVDLKQQLPQIVRQLRLLRAENLVADGVLVALDSNNRPCGSQLERALDEEEEAKDVQLYLFDLLYYDEWDLRKFPLSERKAALASVLPAASQVFFVDHERSRAEDLLATVTNLGLPGLIAKRASSSYQRGAADDWLELSATDIPVGEQGDLAQALDSQSEMSFDSRANRVKFTNRKKVLWPQDGITKGDLIDYYDHVADVLIPYLKDRPLSLNRFPNGIDAHSFYQKHTPRHVPEWVETIDVASSGNRDRVRFVICNDRATLLYLANLASIDLHPWLSTRAVPDQPDWAVFDLDPDEVPFKHVVTVARSLGKLLRGIGLRPYLKTSGAKGLHIYVPLAAGYTYDQSRTFCEGVANIIVEKHPKLATIERVKSRRRRKVYIDFLQNRRGQTVVSPYVVRPVIGAGVSAPLEWDELEGDLHPSMFNLHSLAARLAARGDLFAPALTDRQDLMPAIQAIIDRFDGSQ